MGHPSNPKDAKELGQLRQKLSDATDMATDALTHIDSEGRLTGDDADKFEKADQEVTAIQKRIKEIQDPST